MGWDRVRDGLGASLGRHHCPVSRGCYRGSQPGSTQFSLLPGSEMRLLALTHAITIASQHGPPTHPEAFTRNVLIGTSVMFFERLKTGELHIRLCLYKYPESSILL